MEKVRPWCGQPSDRGRLKNRTAAGFSRPVPTPVRKLCFYYSAPDRKAEYCNEHVCLSVCVCLSTIIGLSSELHVRSSPNFLCMLPTAVARSSSSGVVLCTSGFMDDVIFAHKPRLLDVAAQLKQCTCNLGLGYKLCAVVPVTC